MEVCPVRVRDCFFLLACVLIPVSSTLRLLLTSDSLRLLLPNLQAFVACFWQFALAAFKLAGLKIDY
jgi:hypothetical protein